MSEAMANSFVEADGASTQIKWIPISGPGESAHPKCDAGQRFAGPGDRAGIKLPFPTFPEQSLKCFARFLSTMAVSDVYGDVGQSNYNALQLSIQQRLSRGLTFNLNYTFSKALGTIYGNRSAYIQEKTLHD